MTDSDLLTQYVERASEEAFTALVRRHLSLVYSAALRQMGGDRPSAQDVTQQVFTDLARKAPSLQRHSALTGWLYTSTHFAAANALRAERRRKVRETEAHQMHDILTSSPEADWDRLRPVIDDAMQGLNERDRNALLFRFFDQQSLRSVGEKLGLTENAAQMRVDRALEKLRRVLVQRGISSTGVALGAVLGAHATVAAPAGLEAVVVAGALGQAAAGGAVVTLGLLHSVAATKAAFGLAGMLGVVALGVGIYCSSQARAARDTLAAANLESDALLSHMRDLNRQIVALEAGNASSQATLARLSASRHSAPVLREFDQIARAQRREFVATLAANNQLPALVLRQAKAAYTLNYRRLFAALKLSPAQAEQFAAVLLAKQNEILDLMKSAVAGGSTLEADLAAEPGMQPRLDDLDARTATAIRALVGDAGYAQFQEYEATEAARDLADTLAANLYYCEASLTSAQSVRLTALIAAHSPTHRAGGEVDSESIEWDAVLAEARGLLSPAQLAALKTLRTVEDYDRELAAQGSRVRFGGLSTP